MKEIVIKGFKTIKETSEPEVSKIVGSIPDWVSGSFIRNGPAKWDFQDFHMHHVFDGYNMLSKFEICGGKSGTVTFSSKFLSSEAYKKAEAAQKPVISEYATRAACSDSKKSVFARMISSLIPEQTDNCPFICSTPMGENPIAIGDTGYMFEIDQKSLECIHRYDPIKELGVHCLTSHPVVDTDTGYTYNVGISLFSGAKWNIIKFPPANKTKVSIKNAEVVTTFNCRNKTSIPWVHSFGMSKNYILIIDQPSYFNATKVIGSIFSKGVCPKDLNEWRPEQKCRFYLVHKSGKLIKTEILSKEAFAFYHVWNCFEEDGHIIIDLFTLPNLEVIDNLSVKNIRSGWSNSDMDAPVLKRFVIPLEMSAADIRTYPENTNLVSLNTTATASREGNRICLEPEILFNGIECSTFNKNFQFNKSIVWGTGAFVPSHHHHRIFKLDLETREVITLNLKENQFVGESLFVENPQGENEDDGIIINVINNYQDVNNGENDFILFLDARNLQEIGRASFPKSEIPIAFHGVWIA